MRHWQFEAYKWAVGIFLQPDAINSFENAFLQLSFSPTTPGWSHFRLIALLSSIFSISAVMIIVSIVFGLFSGINMFAFMGAEVSTYLRYFVLWSCLRNLNFLLQCLILAIRTLHVLIRYGMFLYDMRQGAISNDCKLRAQKIVNKTLNFFPLKRFPGTNAAQCHTIQSLALTWEHCSWTLRITFICFSGPTFSFLWQAWWSSCS